VFKGEIYVAGREALGRQDSPLFQEFNPQTGSWRDLARMPAYFIGGSSSCGSDKPSLPVYAFRLP
jgi:hypothetical protein